MGLSSSAVASLVRNHAHSARLTIRGELTAADEVVVDRWELSDGQWTGVATFGPLRQRIMADGVQVLVDGESQGVLPMDRVDLAAGMTFDVEVVLRG